MTDRRADQAEEDTAATVAAPLSASRVAAFLRAHPDFLARRPELLSVLTPPALARGEAVVDMQQFMLMRLQDETKRLREEQRLLIGAARANQQSQSRIHDGILALLGARTFEHLVHTMTTDLVLLLDVDVVTICVETADGRLPRVDVHGLAALEPGAVDELVGPGHDVVLNDEIEGDPKLFGAGAGLVRSEALIRLTVSGNGPRCLMAIGSRDPQRFHPGQGTELLSFLGKVGALSIRSWLDLPPPR